MIRAFLLSLVFAIVASLGAILWRSYDENLFNWILLHPFLKISEVVSPHVIHTPEGPVQEGTPVNLLFGLLGLAANIAALSALSLGVWAVRLRARETES